MKNILIATDNKEFIFMMRFITGWIQLSRVTYVPWQLVMAKLIL